MANPLPRLYAPITAAGVRGGTPLTLDRAIDLLESLTREQAQIERQYYHALARYEAVKTPLAKSRWRGRLDAYREPFVKLDRAVERLQNQVDAYGDALVLREEQQDAARARPPEPEPEEDTAAEWQFGLEYEATRRGGHDVDLNVDVRRKDGQPMTATEAKAALHARITQGMFPDQYEFATVLYRSPGSRSARGSTFRSGGYDADDLDDAFDAVIGATNINDWRMGGIGE